MQWTNLTYIESPKVHFANQLSAGVLNPLLTAANQMQSALRGLVLLDVRLPLDWERVVELRFGPRLDDCTQCLYLEIMGK